MRICRFATNDHVPQVGLFVDELVIPLSAAAAAHARATGETPAPFQGDDLLDFLPPHGQYLAAARAIASWAERSPDALPPEARLDLAAVELLLPIPRPSKLLLLAGNYNALILDGGGQPTGRAETFPYLFSKPASTTLTASGKPVLLPRISPDRIDWEIELGVVMGARCRHVPEAEALKYVAGYTVINDISDRGLRSNPQRTERRDDGWFDWEHGKWHDTFCPCGPCIASADAIPDPQRLAMKLWVNGDLKQDANTDQQIFPVAAAVEFISDLVTLEPGDIISTGTPGGVGHASGTYLAPGDRMAAWIEGIGTLASPVAAEATAGAAAPLATARR